ncbi:MAG: glutamine-hydrolyzing GMP synthase, partial [Chthoniobacterales bacterium]
MSRPGAGGASPSKVVILDFGSQYTQVIARRVRECRVYSEILPHTTPAAVIKRSGAAGVVFSGGPASVYGAKAPRVDRGIYRLGLPILGICYGMQLIARDLGGAVESSAEREYGPGRLTVTRKNKLFAGLPKHLDVWNSHGDKVTRLPSGFTAVGTTENSKAAAIADA